ncbi:MAG: Na+/H+ antiporter NhaC [Candidatus Hydrogenedentes bacterium]|nr:Na+/H+ antiporter NhaC [Candidatus Hydrogenedentota bacterium]
MERPATSPTLLLSLIPVFFLIALLILNVTLFGDAASSGANQVALLLTAILAGGIGHFWLGMNYRDIEQRAIKSIVLAMEAVIILLIVGALIGLWIMSGVVPTMLYYGILLINPTVFLIVACVICSIVSLAIGSSWSTMGTVGIALIGIGKALGFPEALVAGAIVSGAYLGDKMSPLSDTTNLAPAVAGTNLFTHIRHMLYTTVPAYILTLIIFGGIGLFYTAHEMPATMIEDLAQALQQEFHIAWYLLLIPLVVIVAAAARIPAIPTLVFGAILGGATAVFFQPGVFDATGPAGIYAQIIATAYSGFASETGNTMLDALLSRGGMMNMFGTIVLIVMAMLFGGAMEATGMLPRIAGTILRTVRGAGSLIAATIATCVVFNFTASDQYLAIVIPGRMFRQAYETFKLEPRNLSRALEDGATVTSVLVPWNTCGAFAASVLAVSTLDYAPFCFFNLLCPVVSVTMAGFHIAIKYIDAPSQSEPTPPVP